VRSMKGRNPALDFFRGQLTEDLREFQAM
jgi:hypothetical protein